MELNILIPQYRREIVKNEKCPKEIDGQMIFHGIRSYLELKVTFNVIFFQSIKTVFSNTVCLRLLYPVDRRKLHCIIVQNFGTTMKNYFFEPRNGIQKKDRNTDVQVFPKTIEKLQSSIQKIRKRNKSKIINCHDKHLVLNSFMYNFPNASVNLIQICCRT